MFRKFAHYAVSVLLFLGATHGIACGLEIEPFHTSNLSPLLQIYGLPAETSASLVPAGNWRIGLSQDIASIYSSNATAAEQILLDGELYRWTLAGRYGLKDTVELGMEIPLVMHRSGFMDSFITDWHKFWGLPQGGRDTAPKDRLLYLYKKNGVPQIDLNSATGGIGDISLLAGWKLFEQQTAADHDMLALRGQLKLPTGDSASLLGSGGADIAIFLAGAANRATEWGIGGIFGSVGGIYSSDGDILASQRKNLVGFGTVGAGWSPTGLISFKVQCSLNSPFYKQTSLSELDNVGALLTIGGALKLPGNYILDIAVGEDIAVNTAPDVTFHLGLKKDF
jgi:hypothetical protein